MSREAENGVSIPLLLDLDDVPGLAPAAPAPRARARDEGRRSPRFEIGVVYTKRAQLFLAVSQSTLVTIRAGEVQELRPTCAYDPARSVSVDELCRAWAISPEQLDRIAKKYVAPSSDGVMPRPRGTRRRAGVEELVGLVLRKVRIAG